MTLREIEIELMNQVKWQEEVELPMLAILATWTAAQTRAKKMKSAQDLLRGKKQKMSRMEMISNLEAIYQKSKVKKDA